MPRRYTKKRTYKRKAAKPMRYKVADAAYTALKMAKQIKDAVNIEYKEYPATILNTNLDTAGVVYPLATITQGYNNAQRIGDSVKLQRLTCRGVIIQGTGSATTQVRMVLFRGKAEDFKTYSLSTDLFETTSSANYIYSSKLEQEKYNTKFLLDRRFVLDTAKQNIIPFKFNMPLNWHIEYGASGSTQVKNAGFYLAIMSDRVIGSPAINYPSITFNYTISYTDD